MSNQNKFANGAFVFSRARGLRPMKPEEVVPIALRHGYDASIVPAYAGDRAAIGRAIARTDTVIVGTQYLLRPIKRTQTEVVYGIVHEQRDGEAHLDHNHEATLRWSAEPHPEYIEGEHTLAKRVHLKFAELRGKLVADDWTAFVGEQLDQLGAAAMRDDGRVHWLPPQSLDAARKLQAFLSEVGVMLILAEVAAENAAVVTEVVAESLDDAIHKLELEVREFDETQKPSMFMKRLETYQALRERALLYKSALGIGTERAEQVLGELEKKVSGMLDVRQGMTVHRDGRVSRRDEPAAVTVSSKPSDPPKPSVTTTAIRSLKFAGAEFVAAASNEPDELLFTSGEEKAKSSVALLESMGIAGRWQKAGSAEFNVQNSGPVGAEVSVRLRLHGERDLTAASKALRAVGVELAA
jgi:hypothetical protein